MKRRILALVLAALMALALLTGCGDGQTQAQSSAESSPAAQQAEGSAAAVSASKAPAEENTSAATSETSEASNNAAASAQAAVSASHYAWLGLQDMPSCPYLDAFCTYHYYREYTSYVSGYAMKYTEAVDGINTFKGTDTTRTYSVGGKVITFNDSSKTYMEYDMGSGLVEQAKSNMEQAKAEGTNMVGRAFVTTGSGVIPVYSETEDDQTEYEYYEYNYPAYEENDYQIVERFYMKDGDVFAFYQATSTKGGDPMEMTEVIQSMSGEIPEGTFEIPSTDGYEELKTGDK